ncbi:hypothetical protein ACFQYP_37915 [Nonomuraea antimicrobica]
MNNALPCCGDCGHNVIMVYLFDRGGIRIDLDPEPVVGGNYTFWNPTYGRQKIWRAKSRPTTVPPPRDLPEHLRRQWNGEKVADSRTWFVQHVCGLTAAQIVAERRARLSA